MMEDPEFLPSKSPSRHKPLRRSLSAQPEEPKLSSSPYSTRKRLTLPGRSLTEYFSHRSDRSGRAGSDDTHVSQRRVSASGTSTNTLQLVPLAEEDRMSVSSGYSEPQLDSTPGFKVYTEYQRTIIYSFDSDSQTPRPTAISDRRLSTRRVGDGGTPLPKSLRKRQKVAEVSDSKPVVKDDLVCWKNVKRFGKIVFFLLTLILSSILIMIGISTLLVYQEAICEQRKNSVLPIEKLQTELSEHMVGQDVAINILMNALRVFVSEKSEVPLVLWLVGSTGTGKTLTINAVKNTLSNSTHIQDIIPSFLPHDVTGLSRVCDHIFNGLDSCGFNLVVIDGWDKESSGPHTLLENILLRIQSNRDKGHIKGRIVFFLSGTHGSDEVNNHFLKLQASSKTREELQSEDFASLSSLKGEITAISNISKNIVLVPFIPIDADVVRLCIKKELQRVNRGNFLLSKEKLERITEETLGHLEFSPSPLRAWSLSGCKRIPSLLTLILADTQYSVH